MQFIMSFSIGSWAFGNAPLEQACARVFSARHTGTDLIAPGQVARRAAPLGYGAQADGGAKGRKALAVRSGAVAKRDASAAGRLEHRMGQGLGREAKP